MDHELKTLVDRVPGWRGRARVVGPLEGGITNRNFLVDVAGERFVLRLAGKDTHLLGIDREVERAANEQAATLGIAPEVVAFLEPEGYLVTRFVVGAPIPPEQMAAPATLGLVAPVLRAFHGSRPIAGDFDCFQVPETYAATARERGVAVPDAYAEAAVRSREIEAAFSAAPESRAPCHNDLLNANFLRDADRVWLLDWEYAGMNDRYFDLGNFAVNNDLDGDGEAALLQAYFGGTTARRRARLALMKVMSDFREAMWGVVQQGISSLDFDYVAYAAKHFDRLLANASVPEYPRLLEEAARA